MQAVRPSRRRRWCGWPQGPHPGRPSAMVSGEAPANGRWPGSWPRGRWGADPAPECGRVKGGCLWGRENERTCSLRQWEVGAC